MFPSCPLQLPLRGSELRRPDGRRPDLLLLRQRQRRRRCAIRIQPRKFKRAGSAFEVSVIESSNVLSSRTQGSSK